MSLPLRTKQNWTMFKSYFTLIILLLGCLSTSFTQDPEDCCPIVNVYGDDDSNEANYIRHLGGATYLLGSSDFGSDENPIVVKLNSKMEPIWEVRLGFEGIMYDAAITDNNELLVVGRTYPSLSNNRSVLCKISATGQVLFTRFYNLDARESFLRIIRHPSPQNQNFPFYISGAASPQVIPIVTESVYLLNINANGDVNYTATYSAKAINQFGSGIIPLTNGDLLLFGNVKPMGATVVQVNQQGTVIKASEMPGFRYLDAVQLSNGNFALSGYKDESPDEACLFLLDKDLDFLDLKNYGKDLNTFYCIAKDASDNIYTTADSDQDQSVIFRNSVSNQLTLTKSVFFESGESKFYYPDLDVHGNDIYFTDTRKKHPKGYGKRDIILAKLDKSLTENCLDNFQVTPIKEVATVLPLSATLMFLSEPNFTQNPVNNVQFKFTSTPECDPPLEEDCMNGIDDDGDGLIDFMDPDCICNQVGGIEYVPNGDFENVMSCEFGNIEAQLGNWKQIGGSPDVINENCLGTDGYKENEIFYGVSTSTYIQIGATDVGSESFGTCLAQPIEQNKVMTLTMDFNMSDIYDETNMDTLTGALNIYGWYSCQKFNDHANGGSFCFDKVSDAQLIHSIDFKNYKQAAWQNIKKEFVVSQQIEAISIEMECGAEPLSSLFTFMALDNIHIREKGTNFHDSIAIIGAYCEETFELKVKDSSNFTYQWYIDNEIIDGATKSTYKVNKLKDKIPGEYKVLIYNEVESCAILDSLVVPLITSVEIPTEMINICQGDSVFFDDTWLLAEGFYSDTLKTINGCDSILSISIVFNDKAIVNNKDSLCEGESYTFKDSTWSTSGDYSFLVDGLNSCDTLYNFSLTFNPSYDELSEVSICEGKSYTYQGQELTEEKIYTFEYENEFGCLSTQRIDLKVNKVYSNYEMHEICEGDTFFFQNNALFEEQLYTFVLPSKDQCDSTIQIDIKLKNGGSSEETQTICAGTSYDYNGNSLTEAGSYPFYFQNGSGCDSVHTITLSVIDSAKFEENIQLCSGENIVVDSDVISTTGTYTYNYTSKQGCDSLYTLNVQVYDTSWVSNDLDICAGDFFVLKNDTIREPGTYSASYTNNNGCDSTQVWNISVLKTSTDTLETIVLEAGGSYVFGNDTLTKSGTYSTTLLNAAGCDSIVTVKIRVKEVKNDIYIPNIFTPNGDGTNDVFVINTAPGVELTAIRIFDRWGNMVYKNEQNLKNWIGWNGRWKNSNVVPGVYAYIVNYKNAINQTFMQSGNLTVIF